MRCFILCLLLTLLMGCAVPLSNPPAERVPYPVAARLAQGKRNFERGFYKRAMRDLLPLACDGYVEAQYAVGYMYYYGYGVGQDTDVGFFWIDRAACKEFPPAVWALRIMDNQAPKDKRLKRKFACMDP